MGVLVFNEKKDAVQYAHEHNSKQLVSEGWHYVIRRAGNKWHVEKVRHNR